MSEVRAFLSVVLVAISGAALADELFGQASVSTATPSKFTAPAFAYSESMRPNPISFATTRTAAQTAAGRKHRMRCSTSLTVARSNASR